MARILLATFGSYGDLNPFLALGLALKRRGHDPVIATAEIYRPDVGRLGLAFAPVRPDMAGDDQALFERAMDPMRGSEVVVREIMMPRVRESYEDLGRAAEGADLLVSHVITYAVPVLAETRRMRWVSVALQPLVFFSCHDPPVIPPAPWLGVLRPLGPTFHRGLIALMKRISRPWGDELRRLRRELGLPPGGDPVFEGQHSPYGVLAMFSPLFAASQPDWPPNVSLCGFPFHDEDIGGQGLDRALAAFLSAGPAPIVFTLGTSAVRVAGDFYRRAAEAALSLKMRAVLLAGPGAGELGPLPDGIFVAATAPYHALFPRCAAIVHSGGIGTTGQALRSGVPQLAVPFAHDQFDNAARAVRMGCGLSASHKRFARSLGRLLADEDIARRSAEVGAAVRAERGVEAACDAIVRVLGLPR